MGIRGKTGMGLFAGLMAAQSALAELTHCEPRSQQDPGRLNLSARASQYGVLPPCLATLEAYIPRTTALREFGGSLAIHDAEGKKLASQDLRLRLESTDYGMFAGEVTLGPVAGHVCHALSLSMTITQCLGESGESIECPEVWVRTPQGFETFSADGAGVAVCRD